MHRNITVLAISIINGFCIFLLCMRLWRLEKAEILTPTHSISIALIAKILFTLLTDNGCLAADCIWNTSLLPLYTIFIHAADRHDLLSRYKVERPTSRFMFTSNSTITQRIENPWTDYKFIVSVIFLILVFFNPFLFKYPKSQNKSKVTDAMIAKYRKILQMKILKRRQRQEERELFEKVEKPWTKTMAPRKTQSHQIHVKSKCVKGPKSQDSIQIPKTNYNDKNTAFNNDEHGDEDMLNEVSERNSVVYRDGTGDNRFSSTLVHSFELRTMKTQTDLKINHPSKSKGIQCLRYPAHRSYRSVTSRPAGSSTGYLFCQSDKSTNTLPAQVVFPKKAKTKTKSTNPIYKPNQTISKSKEQNIVKDAQKSILAYQNLRKEIRRHLKPAIEITASIVEQAPMIAGLRKPRPEKSEIFNLDDLINAKFVHSAEIERTEKQKRAFGLDVIPTKDNHAIEEQGDSLNVLYVTERMLNSVGINQSDLEFDHTRYPRYNNSRRYKK